MTCINNKKKTSEVIEMEEKRDAAIALARCIKQMPLTDYELGVLQGLTINQAFLEEIEKKQKEKNAGKSA